VNAIVTDKQGNPVKDLTRDDFKIYEDGKPQPIHTFALESYKSTQATDERGKVNEPDPGKTAAEPSFTQSRFMSLVIDDITTSSSDQFFRSIEAMQRFVAEEMGPGDQVGILAASGRVQYPFTNDKAVLTEQINTLHGKLNRGTVHRQDCPELTDLQAQQIRNQYPDNRSLEVAIVETILCEHMEADPNRLQTATNLVRSRSAQLYEETQYRNRTLLSTLRQHVRSLKHIEAKKSLILFSDGFLIEDLRYELQDIVDVALRAGVIINTLDMRGLFTDNYQASDRVAVGYTVETQTVLAQKPLLRTEDMLRQADPLGELAHETGGIFFHNSNDLYAGLRKISNTQSFYYVLSYASPAPKNDGRYHKIKLEVARPGVQVSHRKGYYAPKEQISFERRKKEDIIEALQASGNLNEIPIHLSYNYYQVDEARYQLALLTNVNIRGLEFLDEDARHKNLIHLVVVAFDENDRYVDGLEKAMDLNLSDPSYAALRNFGFTSKVDIKVPPGRYKIKAVVRESVHSKMGSINKTIEVP
jgi:VWFA-related protein